MTEAEIIRLLMELRRQGITSQAVLNAIERVPRDLFVPETFRDKAYDNTALPIAGGQTISQPFIVAYMTQHLELGDRMTVLEVGTGSGYQTAVLARLARRVYSIERVPSLSKTATQRLARLGVSNVTLRVGDGLKGWPEAGPFDRIIVTAAVESTPDDLTQQLKPGGILIMPLGDSSDSQHLVKLENTDSGLISTELIPVRFVPALGGVAKDP